MPIWTFPRDFQADEYSATWNSNSGAVKLNLLRHTFKAELVLLTYVARPMRNAIEGPELTKHQIYDREKSQKITLM